jgi:hypothetical protein
MSSKSSLEITHSDIRRVFLVSANPNHRQYEALRAYFIDRIPSAETAESVDFFDALSFAVAIKVDCDLQLTLMTSSLYRLLGEQIGEDNATAKSPHVFRDFINPTVANVMITESEIHVRFQKRAYSPFVMAAGFPDRSAGSMSGKPAPADGLRVAVGSAVQLTPRLPCPPGTRMLIPRGTVEFQARARTDPQSHALNGVVKRLRPMVPLERNRVGPITRNPAYGRLRSVEPPFVRAAVGDFLRSRFCI